MSLTGTRLEQALGPQQTGSRFAERPEQTGGLVSWPAVSIGLMVVLGCGAIASIAMAVGAIWNANLPNKTALALSTFYLWKLDLGSRLLQINSRIIVVNCVAALVFAIFGTLAAMMEASLRLKHRGYDRLEGLSGRPLARVAAWFFPRLRLISDPIARETAALALAFPFLGLAANGLVIGVLLGTAAWSGPHELASSLKLFWPHGIIELPTLLVAAAIGVANGIALVRAGRHGPQAIAAVGGRRLRSRRLWFTMLAVFVLLAIAGMIEPTGVGKPSLAESASSASVSLPARP